MAGLEKPLSGPWMAEDGPGGRRQAEVGREDVVGVAGAAVGVAVKVSPVPAVLVGLLGL